MALLNNIKISQWNLIILLYIGLLAISCDKEVYQDIYKPDGTLANIKELSAGQSTTFTFTSVAFDTPADWAGDGPMYTRFLDGDGLYDTPRQYDNGPYGGLGPLYCGFSCAGCHNNAGRSKSTLFTHGGSGKGFSSFLTFMRSPNDQYHRDYGRVLHDQAVFGYQPEGRLRVTYSEQEYAFPDGEKYSLRTPHYEIYDWYADSIPPEQLEMSVRTPLRHVGMGLMLAVDPNEIKALEKQQYPEFGISGEINWIIERGAKQMGLSGHKAHHADLTVELGFLSDMGVTSTRYPEEIGYGQDQNEGDDPSIEISLEDMADVDYYLHTLGVPARRNIDDPEVQKGEELFVRAKCHLCHTATLHTRPEGVTLIDGTPLPWLGGQTIHPYTDYLVHDMGPELGDNFSQFNASGDEWRTAPLWGIGLQEVVNGHTDFLHDARARNYVEAIMWHGGEGDVSRQIFYNMTKEERDALVAFLRSL